MQLPDAIDAIRPSVVQIQATNPNGWLQGNAIGTGFIVAPELIVTAKHVVDAVNVVAGQALSVGFAGPEIDTPQLKMRANFVAAGGQVLAVEADHDLALLVVPGAQELIKDVMWGDDIVQPTPKPVRLSTSKLREGTALAVSGYPLDEPSLVTNAGVLASSFSPQQTGTALHERFLGDFTANPGNSGGPVYRVGDAAVVGVCVAGKLAPIVGGVGAHAAGLTLIVPATEVVALLEKAGLPVEQGPKVPSTSTRSKRRKRR